MRKISQEEAEWFASWMNSQSTPPIYSKYTIIIPHGENTIDFNREFPVQGSTSTSTECLISPQQAKTLDRTFLNHLAAETPCCLAMYAGFIHTAWGAKNNFYEPEGTWMFGLLNYVLFATSLAEGSFGATEERWRGVLTERSYLWAEDHSWFVSAHPDAAGTIVGTESNDLAKALLNEKTLRAVSIPYITLNGFT